MNGDVKQMNDDQLIVSLKKSVVQERKVLTRVLAHLREVEDRGLHLRRGYSHL